MLKKIRVGYVAVLVVLLAVCLVCFWLTQGAMAHLSFLHNSRQSSVTSTLVDLRPWQTAEALAGLAATSEESDYAHQAEHLADHEVDQAFGAALRRAGLEAQSQTLSGEALALKQKIAQLEDLRRQDQAVVDQLAAKAPPAKNDESAENDDLQVAKAQLGLDTDQLNEARQDLQRASGDKSGQIQNELAAHEQSMRKYDSQAQGGQMAVVSVGRNHTLFSRIRAWFSQRQRKGLIAQARQQALEDVRTITAEHNALEAQANTAQANGAAPAESISDRAAKVANLRRRSIVREILSIDDDRIQTEQQLADVYAKWSAQVDFQHRIVLHLILGSLSLILFILIAGAFCDAAIRYWMDRSAQDRRQMHTLRSILELGIQVLGAVLILLVVFGTPQQTPTILGLTTAALTFALQDYIVAFLGWFALMGRNGIHAGDWVEINGVGGEVVEVRLMTTTLLETGGLAQQGYPTGRRITFMNSFAIRGKYFNFSTAGQWMWDEIVVPLPASVDVHVMAQQIQQTVLDESREKVHRAEQEWKHATRNQIVGRFSAAPVVNVRPSGSGIELQVRYVTAAGERDELRNRLYQRIVDLLHSPSPLPRPA